MHFSPKSLALAAAAASSFLVAPAHADFMIYRVERDRPRAHGGFSVIWQSFYSEPSCEEALNTGYLKNLQDVSGDKVGIRCKGSGCKAIAPIEDIEILEMHYSNNPLYHWTIYRDRGYTMVGLDGRTYGQCYTYPYGDYDCPYNAGSSKIEGRRKFRCVTDVLGPKLW